MKSTNCFAHLIVLLFLFSFLSLRSLAQDSVDIPRAESAGPTMSRGPGNGSVFEETRIDYVVMIVLNVNQEFQSKMDLDDAAFQHVLSIIETFNRDTVGSEARLIITQTGCGEREDPLLWEGSPREIRKQFATPDDFRKFVDRKISTSAPAAIRGLVTSTRYLLNHEALENPECRPAIFIVSDAQDATPYEESFKNCADLANNFVELARLDGICGWYFVDHLNLEWATNVVRRSGFKGYRVEADVVRRPRVPRFE